MKIQTQFRDAITNIFAAKLRSVLAVLGILVGTASVVAMVSGGQLATRQALLQFKNLGTDLLSVSIMPGQSTMTNSSENKLSLNTVMNLQNVSSDITEIAPYTNIYPGIEFADKKIEGQVVGVTDDFFKITKLNMQQGRYIYYIDKTSPYCVIGHNIYEQIKPYTVNPIGQQIRLGDNIFTIIGVAKSQPENAFIYTNVNDTIFIPIQTSQIIPYSDIHNILLKLTEKANIDKLTTAINQYFAKNYSGSRLYIFSAKQFIASMTKQKQILTIFLGLIGAISLIVGGIGIMNIMLVSVTERRREIGIRLAVGAKRRDIRSLFLVESTTLALLGGILGVLLGILISFAIAEIKHWQFTLFFIPPLIGFSVSVFVGVFFGFYPAYKASKLDPIETLRSE